MKTVFCPLCNAALHIAFKMQKAEGWKRCNSCNQPVYLSVDADGNASRISLKELIDGIVKTKPGIEMLEYMLKQNENAMQDITFTAGGIVRKDVEFLTEVHVFEKTIRGYSVKEALKPHIAEQLAPYIKKPDIFKEMV